MTAPPRYREESGRSCIDVHLKSARTLFDGRDPAPFRERDLDEDASEYIALAVEDLHTKAKLKIVLWIVDALPPELPPETISEAVRAHFAYRRAKLDRALRDHVRRGQLLLLVGLAVLGVFLTLAELTAYLEPGHFRQILREGLVITGWVAMWRPLEVLLYDWWPLLTRRRLHDRILGAEIAVRIHDATGSAP